jgi:hypothetical protein
VHCLVLPLEPGTARILLSTNDNTACLSLAPTRPNRHYASTTYADQT